MHCLALKKESSTDHFTSLFSFIFMLVYIEHLFFPFNWILIHT